MTITPEMNAARAALRASLTSIETAARLAQQAIDSDQPATVLGRCVDELDQGFEAFDRARVELNKQQAEGLQDWAGTARPQSAEEVIGEWRQEEREKQQNDSN